MMEKLQFNNYPLATKEEIRGALDRACAQVEKNLPEFTYKYQSASSTDSFYTPIINKDWTNGFWTGEIWLAYEHTKKNTLKYAALIQVEDFYKRISEGFSVDHHDLGFLYSLSCVAGYKLTKDETAKKAAIMAAEKLITRFQEKGEVRFTIEIKGLQHQGTVLDTSCFTTAVSRDEQDIIFFRIIVFSIDDIVGFSL